MESKSELMRKEVQIPYLFVYGILKRGKSLDLTHKGCEFLGKAELPGATLYNVGHGVGLRLNDNKLSRAHGELFRIPASLWRWLDIVESNGHIYTRKIVHPVDDNDKVVTAWVYEHNFDHFLPEDEVKGNEWRGDY